MMIATPPHHHTIPLGNMEGGSVEYTPRAYLAAQAARMKVLNEMSECSI
jgi:hypothetical protein